MGWHTCYAAPPPAPPAKGLTVGNVGLYIIEYLSGKWSQIQHFRQIDRSTNVIVIPGKHSHMMTDVMCLQKDPVIFCKSYTQ